MITRERGILITLTVLALSGTGVLVRHTANAAAIPAVLKGGDITLFIPKEAMPVMTAALRKP